MPPAWTMHLVLGELLRGWRLPCTGTAPAPHLKALEQGIQAQTVPPTHLQTYKGTSLEHSP